MIRIEGVAVPIHRISLSATPLAALALAGGGERDAADAASAPDAAAAAKDAPTDWPHVDSAIAADPAIEARVREIVAGMTLAQKVGQMTQAEIKSVTPEQVREYYIGPDRRRRGEGKSGAVRVEVGGRQYDNK